jgi:quercetin dioxygenase-like cupin family protein
LIGCLSGRGGGESNHHDKRQEQSPSSFDEGQGLSEHTAPFDALVFLLDGEAEISISGKPFLLREGEMIIMPANQPHALKALKKFKMLLAMIRS